MDAKQLALLRDRFPEWHLRQRLQRQIEHTVMRFETRGVSLFNIYWENVDVMPKLLGLLLRLTRQLHKAQQETLNYQVRLHDLPIVGLPSSFNGYRILHLSDLHIDQIPDGGWALRSLVASMRYDLCVITGDFRFDTCGSCEQTMICMANLMQVIECPDGVIGILGNHDFIEMLPQLEAVGITMLINEVTSITRGRQQLWVAGLDDCHFYDVADLKATQAHIPEGAANVLLVHSPELVEQAAAAGVSLYLCGHTHGGQVCLPGGVPIILNARCPRRFGRGLWRSGNMLGYTSSGAGSSGISVRINCPPEVALHTLHCP
jgi:predicted MPP superfamily phosphohydrolase